MCCFSKIAKSAKSLHPTVLFLILVIWKRPLYCTQPLHPGQQNIKLFLCIGLLSGLADEAVPGHRSSGGGRYSQPLHPGQQNIKLFFCIGLLSGVADEALPGSQSSRGGHYTHYTAFAPCPAIYKVVFT